MFFFGLDEKEAIFATTPQTRVTGHFDNAFYDAAFGESTLDTTVPRFLCPFSLVRNIPRGTTVTLDGAQWWVAEIKAEGTGLATVILSKDSDV